MYNFLHLLQIKGLCNRRTGIIENGSWAPSAGRVISEMLAQMKGMDVAAPQVTFRSRLHAEDRDRIAELASAISE